MIQIIGWLLCVYLVVKGCELLAMQTRNAFGTVLAVIGAIIAFIAAPIFVYLLDVQVQSSGLNGIQAYSDCMRQAQSLDEMSRCKQ